MDNSTFQPPGGPSVDSLCHLWFDIPNTTTTTTPTPTPATTPTTAPATTPTTTTNTNTSATTTTTTTTTLHYNCTTPHYIQQLWWEDHCNHFNHCNHSKKHNSNHLSVHQWIRSATRESQQPTAPIVFLFLKLPPPLCAVLLWYLGPSH